MDLTKGIKHVKEMCDVQMVVVNQNTHDDYMVGLYNGLELALSILEERNPKYIKDDK